MIANVSSLDIVGNTLNDPSKSNNNLSFLHHSSDAKSSGIKRFHRSLSTTEEFLHIQSEEGFI